MGRTDGARDGGGDCGGEAGGEFGGEGGMGGPQYGGGSSGIDRGTEWARGGGGGGKGVRTGTAGAEGPGSGRVEGTDSDTVPGAAEESTTAETAVGRTLELFLGFDVLETCPGSGDSFVLLSAAPYGASTPNSFAPSSSRPAVSIERLSSGLSARERHSSTAAFNEI